MGETNLFISNIEIKDARRLLVMLLLFIPILLLVLVINIKVDPAGLYGKMVNKNEGYEYHVAQALVRGKDVAILQPMDERLLQKYIIEDLNVAPDIAILASSRLMWLGNNIFPGEKVFNNFVPDAILADYLGIFEGYAKKNLYPPRVIILLDPTLIETSVAYGKWDSIKEDTYSMLDRLGGRSEKFKQSVIPQAWFNAVSFSYFQLSMKKLFGSHRQQTRIVNDNIDDGEVFFKDGTCRAGFLSRSMEKSRGAIIRGLYHGKYTALLKINPDQGLEGILEDFMRYLIVHHIRVTLCLLPLHPDLYTCILEAQKSPGTWGIVGVEKYYRGLARKLNLRIIGSYDPAACGLDSNDFYDGYHIKNDVIEKMFKQKGSLCSMPGL